MSDLQIKIRWIIAGLISVVLICIVLLVYPSLPSFQQLQRVDGTVELSTVSTRSENGRQQTLFEVTLDGAPDQTYVVMKGADAEFYKATQTVASGDDVSMWTFPLHQSTDLRVWQLEDRGMRIVNYFEVYGVERKFRNQMIVAAIILLGVVNGWTYFTIAQATAEPPQPRLLEYGG